MNIEPEKLKSLAKDENSFEELKKLLEGNNNLAEETLNRFNNSFVIIRTREPEKKVFISDSVKNVIGYTADEIRSMPGGLFSLVHEDDIQEVKKIFTEFETSPQQYSMSKSYRVISKNKSVKWITEEIIAERDRHGRIKKNSSLIYDVTSVKINEQKIKEKNGKLVEINQSKDRFISIVSHDLRAPFTSLLGFSEILLNEKELPEEEKTEYLNYIYDASKNQLQMINYLLEWSRLQTGRIIPEIRRLNLRTVVSTCVSSLIGNAIRKEVDLVQDIDDNIFVQADEKLLGQAISNLIGNAIKFTPKYKTVTVTSNKFKEGFIEVVVKDEGVGISETNKDKVFKIDQKFSLKGTEGEKGSGLGLTLVKEIVERLNGDIWFYSKENSGTEFHFTIPEAKNVILLVEDDKSLMGLYRKSIDKNFNGYKVVQSINGYEAMSLIMNSLPTIVITDHDMPLMNGIQLVEAIRKRDTNFTIPVIVISAKLDDRLKEKYSDLGVSKILNKPIEPAQLITTMKSFINTDV